jgi:acyl-CoA synthetase (AMP-forming)/AMP-acid ligase II
MNGRPDPGQRSTQLIVGDLPRINSERRMPSVAYIDGDRAWTWAEIDSRVDHLAQLLRDGLGLREGDVVGMLSDNRVECLELMFAASRAGLVHTALKTRGHIKEKIRQAEDARLAALLVGPRFEDEAEQIRAERVGLQLVGVGGATIGHSFEEILNGPAVGPVVARRDPDAVYSVMYTSGSTGEPKGVAISSRNELAYAWSVSWALAAEDDDILLHVLPLVHKGGQFYAMTAALMGLPTVLGQPDPEAMLRAIDAHRVTKIVLVPTIAKRMVELLEQTPARFDVSSVRRLGIGSTALAPDLARRLAKVIPADLCQLGGASEGGLSMVLTSRDYREILGNPELEHRIWSCGRPVPGVRVGILDEQGGIADTGQIGEIAYRGDQFVDSYWNRPEVSDFAWRGGWFHSGDVGYRDADGYVYYVDRLYGRIKTGAETVFSREVEAVLEKHDDVNEVAVVGIPDPHWGERVTAAVVTDRPIPDDEARTLFESELSGLVRDELARFKVPKDYCFVEALPRTDLGKVAYGTLKALVGSTSHEGRGVR